MNYKIFIAIFLFIYSCTTNNINVSNNKVIIQSETYSNKGFTLLFNEDLKKQKLINKKIEERSLIVFQKNLKKNTNIKITNLLNNKTILAKVGVIITENSTFLAKKAKMFDEEKQVAEKAPVEGISINDLSLNKKKNKRIPKKDKFNYIIKIADFYYENTAIMMQKRIKDELNLNSSKISKISNTSFRVYLGPFDNLESLKNAFDDITPLNFENIEIIKL